jgi:hypothetical protein
MKHFLLLLPFLLGSAASAADLYSPRTGGRAVYIEKHPPAVAYRYEGIPSALYDDTFTPPYRSHVWRWRPEYYAHAYGRPHRFHGHWRHPHHRW